MAWVKVTCGYLHTHFCFKNLSWDHVSILALFRYGGLKCIASFDTTTV